MEIKHFLWKVMENELSSLYKINLAVALSGNEKKINGSYTGSTFSYLFVNKRLNLGHGKCLKVLESPGISKSLKCTNPVSRNSP